MSDEKDVYTQPAPAPGSLDPSAPPEQFLGQVLGKLTGYEPAQGDEITPSVSPLDFIPYAKVAEAVVSPAGRILGNEVGAIGANVMSKEAPQFMDALSVARQELNAVAKAAEAGKATQAQLLRAQSKFNQVSDRMQRHIGQGGTAPKGYAEGGVVTPDPIDSFLATPSASPTPAQAPAGLDAFVHDEVQQEKYGSLGQQAITGLEAAAQGATFGLSTGVERALGVPAEDIRGRAEANPITHIAGQVAGVAGSSFIPVVGAGNIMTKAGAGAASALGLGAKGASFISQVGADAVKGVFEAALFQGGEEVSKAFSEDPAQTAQTAIADIGMAALLGGAVSGAVGGGLRALGLGAAEEGGAAAGAAAGRAARTAEEELAPQFVSRMEVEALERGDLKALVKHDNTLESGFKDKVMGALDLGKQKPNASEIVKAQEALGLPATPGMTAGNDAVQMAVDTLAHSPYTLSGSKVKGQLDEAFTAVDNAIQTSARSANKLSKEELGTALQQSLKSDIEKRYEPIRTLYKAVEEEAPLVPLDKNHITQITQKFNEIPQVKLKGSSESRLVNKITEWLENAQVASDLQAIATSAELKPGTDGLNHLRGMLKASIKDAQDAAYMRAAKPEVRAMLREADATYKPFIKDVSALSEWLGKGKIRGVDDAITFFEEKLTASEVAGKVFKQKDPEFFKFFSTKFPEQFNTVREFQRAEIFGKATNAEGVFNPKTFLRNFEKLEPEVKKALYTKEELAKLKDAQTYIYNAFPKNYNPSGTSHIAGFREAMESPKGFAMANIRDAALSSFVKNVGSPKLREANRLARETIRAYDLADKAVKSVLNPDKINMPVAIAASITQREKLKKEVDKHSQNPEGMIDIAGGAPVQEYAAHLSQTAARAVEYLASIRPNSAPKSPLDTKAPLSKAQEAKYNRAVDLIQQPLLVLKHIQDGTLNAQDVLAVKTVYPDLYKSLSSKMMNEITDVVAKGKAISYKARMGMSLFLGQALDSTMKPMSIQSAQTSLLGAPAAAPNAGTAASGMKPKGSPKALSKLPNAYTTTSQAREQRAQKQ